ncbi:MAG: right-handed parallel beta-helix repeat-containing protein, partial [Myxococcota bacterium]
IVRVTGGTFTSAGTIRNGQSGSDGGCVFASSGTVKLYGGAVLSGCEADGVGGAIHAENTAVVQMPSTYGRVTFRENHADSDGGAVSLSGSRVELAGTLVDFVDNESLGNGGGLFAGASQIQLEDAHFEDNTANGLGGAAHLVMGAELDLTGNAEGCDDTDTTDLEVCTLISGNDASEGDGLSFDNAAGTISRVVFDGNAGHGMLLANASDFTFEQLLVINHTDPSRPALSVDETSGAELYTSTFADNDVAGQYLGGAPRMVVGNLIADNTTSGISGQLEGWDNLIQAGMAFPVNPGPGNAHPNGPNPFAAGSPFAGGSGFSAYATAIGVPDTTDITPYPTAMPPWSDLIGAQRPGVGVIWTRGAIQ